MGIRYFAYASNLDPVQMRRRCPGASVVDRARVPGYRLVFPRASRDWAGGVAGIEPCDDEAACVEGVVYDLTPTDLAALDRYEAVAAGAYRRDWIEVMTQTLGPQRVWTYFANPAPQGPSLPSRRYLDAILRGARHHGLSDDYLAMLERLTAHDDAATPHR